MPVTRASQLWEKRWVRGGPALTAPPLIPSPPPGRISLPLHYTPTLFLVSPWMDGARRETRREGALFLGGGEAAERGNTPPARARLIERQWAGDRAEVIEAELGPSVVEGSLCGWMWRMQGGGRGGGGVEGKVWDELRRWLRADGTVEETVVLHVCSSAPLFGWLDGWLGSCLF